MHQEHRNTEKSLLQQLLAERIRKRKLLPRIHSTSHYTKQALTEVKGQRRMARLFGPVMKAMVTQITMLYIHGERKSISEHTAG